MTEINELEGEELARAVGEAQDWVLHYMWFTVDEDGKQYATRWSVDDYRPDRDIAQAWALDAGPDDEWYWTFSEYPHGLACNLETSETTSEYVWVKWADFPTKAHAYATARCRAYLKAKEDA